MDPRRLVSVLVGDDERVRGHGSGYLLTPWLVLTVRHLLTAPGGRQRIAVVVGHPAGSETHRRSGGWCEAVFRDTDIALILLDQQVHVPGQVLWGLPESGVFDYEAVGYPAFARDGEGTERCVEHLTGRLSAYSQGFGGGFVLDQHAAPRQEPGELYWGGVSGAAVFCDGHLVGVVARNDALFENRRLHAVPAHTFAQDAEFVRHLEAHGGSAPVLVSLAGTVVRGRTEVASAPPNSTPIAELTRLSRQYLRAQPASSPQDAADRPFFGREAAVRGIEEWLHPVPGTTAGSALVVTGRMGSGKTALLRRIALLHDAYGRQSVSQRCMAEQDGRAPALTAHVSVQGVDQARLTRLLGAACDVEATTVADITAAAAPDGRATPVVLIDGLDEACLPRELCERLLVPLIESASRPMRLIIGTRPHLVGPLRRPGVSTIHLDEGEYADRGAIEQAVRVQLARPDGNSEWHEASRELLAEAARQAADHAKCSFLLADVLAKVLARRPVRLPAAAEWRHLDDIEGALRTDLLERLGDRLPWAEALLRPLAFARGAGLPSDHVWPRAASLLHGQQYTDSDVAELLGVVGDYVEATTVAEGPHSGTSFRLFHTALADWLAQGHDADDAHQAIAEALIEAVPWIGARTDWHAASRYTLDHLATHARSPRTLGALFADPGFLLHGDPPALLSAVNRVDLPRTAQALRATAVLRPDTPATVRAQVLQAAARRCGADTLADQLDNCCCPPGMTTLWTRRPRILDDELPTGFEGGPRQMTALSWRGQPLCVVLGKRHDEDFLQVLDLETRAPLGEPVPTVPPGRMAESGLIGSVDTSHGRVVVYSSGDRLRRWSLDDARHLEPDLRLEHEDGHATRVVMRAALGRIGTRSFAMVVTESDLLYCFDLDADSPHPLHEPRPLDWLTLRGLALTCPRGTPAVVCLSFRHAECRALDDGSLLSPPWNVTNGLGSLVLLDREDRPGEQALAGFRIQHPMVCDEFAIDLWDPVSGDILDDNDEYHEERRNPFSMDPRYASAWTEEFDGRRRLFLAPGHERHERDPRTGARIGPPCQLRPGAVEILLRGEPHTLGIDDKRLRLRRAGPYAPDPFDRSTWPPEGLRPVTYQELEPPPPIPGPEPLLGVPARPGVHRGEPVLLVTTSYEGRLNEARSATLIDARTGAPRAPSWDIRVSPDEVTAIDWAVRRDRLVVVACHNQLIGDIYRGNASIQIWHPEQPSRVEHVPIDHPGRVVGVHPSGTTDVLYLTVVDGPDLLWELASHTFTPVNLLNDEPLHAFAARWPDLCVPPSRSPVYGSAGTWRMIALDRAEAVPIRLRPPGPADLRYQIPAEDLGAQDAVIDVDGHMTALRLRRGPYGSSGTELEVYLLPTSAADLGPGPVRRRWWRRRKPPPIEGYTFPLEDRLAGLVPAEDSEPGHFYAMGGSRLTGFSLEWEEADPAEVGSPGLVPALYQDMDDYDAGARIEHVLPCPGAGLALFTDDGVTFVRQTSEQ
ncbi:hypothetical protein ACIRLA_15275 [Streptomyces sp. NPDC102364]|uniref:nSTAND1 domain-containing NTPase n=1 Tax=Streptomyces sp. NPDC102364 TaxID=3366161 RepID=UPI003805DAA0